MCQTENFDCDDKENVWHSEEELVAGMGEETKLFEGGKSRACAPHVD